MAQDIEKVINLLADMKRENEINSDSFSRLLNSIEQKAATAERNSSLELVRTYIEELTKSVDNKYTTTLDKFRNIEQALKAVYTGSAKTSDMKDFFDIFSKNVNNLYSEARQEKAILAGMETKLAGLLNNKSDKDDIVRTISLLRKDFENINLSYKNIIDNIDSNLKSILSGLIRIDPLRNNDKVISQIEIMYNALNDITSELKNLNENDSKLEKILSNVVTSEDLKITGGIIDSIVEKTDEIEKHIQSLSGKDDIDGLQKSIDTINQNTENVPDIEKQTRNLTTQIESIKEELSNIAQNVDKVPDAQDLSQSLGKLYTQVGLLVDGLNEINVKSEILKTGSDLENLKEELKIIKNIVSDLNGVLLGKVEETVHSISQESYSGITKAVSDMLNDIPQKEDIDKILSSTEQNYQKIIEKTEDINEKLTSLPEISQHQKEIKEKISTMNYDKEFSSIFDKTSSIENWLIDSNIKENSQKIAQQMELTSTADSVKKISLCTNKIIDLLEALSNSNDIKEVNDNITEIEGKIEEVISILNDESKSSENSEIIDKLSDLERSISEIVSRNDFNDFVDELKFCITKLSTNTGSCTSNIEEMQRLQKRIDNTLQELDFSKATAALEDKFDALSEKIDNLSSKTTAAPDNKSIEDKLDDLKSILEDYAANAAATKEIPAQNSGEVTEYLEGIKELLSNNSSTINNDLYSKVQDIEDSIVNSKTYCENAVNQIINNINNLNLPTLQNNDAATNYTESLNELSSLKSQITNIEELLKQSSPKIEDTNDKEQLYLKNIEEFISEKLADISKNISEVTSNKDFSQDIAAQTNLLEEKISAIQKVLEELSVPTESDNTEFNEKVALINDKLADFKTELQLITTDINEGLTAQNQKIADELEPIKHLLEQINQNSDIEDLKIKLDDLNNTILSHENSDNEEKFKNLYDNLTEKFEENENDLKDFILGDTDAIILKIDDLKDYIEQAAQPVDAKTTNELHDFLASIEDFKSSQEKLINNALNTIQEGISKEHDEIKSLLATAQNHDDILNAVEELKKYFKNKLKVAAETPAKKGEILPEPAFDESDIEDLKDEFSKYSKKIDDLSSHNEQLSAVLQDISNKLDNLDKVSGKEEIEISDAGTDIKDSSDFDFVYALDTLREDIKNLSSSVEKWQKESSPQEKTSADVCNIKYLETLNKNWTKEIKDYLETGKINTKLEKIDAKLDVLASDTTNTDILDTVDSIDGKVETLSESDKKISSMLEELSQKLSQVSENGNNAQELSDIKTLITEQKDYIKTLEPDKKLEAFKKCLEELTQELNSLGTTTDSDKKQLTTTIKEMKDSIMTAVVTIFDQVSFIEESEDIKDFVEERTSEINKNIEQINAQLQQLSSSDSNESSEYTYSMQDIESDLTKLRLALKETQTKNEQINSEDYAKITEKLHSINSLIDSLTRDEMQSLKSEINALKEQTQFLIVNSDKSYDALNNGMEGFEEIINGNIAQKVDELSEMLKNSEKSDTVVRQALIYMGEWIDNVSGNINQISSNAQNINNIEQKIDSLSDKLQNMEDQFSKVENLEMQIVNQQKRIDKLEMSIDKLLSMAENLEDPVSNKKIDKIEKHISKLSTNIEKLAAYVD